MRYIITFHTHYGAMRFHKLCEKKGVYSKLAPVPRELSSSCGVCVCFDASHAPTAEENEDFEQCYAIEPDGAYRKV